VNSLDFTGFLCKNYKNFIFINPLALTCEVRAEITREEVSLRPYQSVLILKPEFDESQVDEILEKITELIQSHGGACLQVDKWGKKRLAYKVKKNRFGYYLNIYHTCENEQLSSLEAKYKLYDAIIKFMVLRLDDKELERAIKKDEPEEVAAPAPAEATEKVEASGDSKAEDSKAEDSKTEPEQKVEPEQTEKS
jgi:small subunit ribosomal protein S6